jgi:4-hydroxy-4-methyl-2-oxoglutarate aldolase
VSKQRIPPASAIADVLAIRGIHGVLSPPLWDVTGLTLTARGRARTVQMVPTDEAGRAFDELYALLDQDLTDAVVVIAGAEPVSAAVWGQILSRAARRSGAVAALIAGAVRDRSELTAEGLAVWAISERTVGATGRARVVDIDVAARIESVTVRPGDEIVLDAGGAVCVPSELAAEVYRDADELCRGERLLLQDLERGVALQEAYAHKRRATAAIRARLANRSARPMPSGRDAAPPGIATPSEEDQLDER